MNDDKTAKYDDVPALSFFIVKNLSEDSMKNER